MTWSARSPPTVSNWGIDSCRRHSPSQMQRPSIDVRRHKVASYEINHVRLLQWLAATGKPLIISHGGCR